MNEHSFFRGLQIWQQWNEEKLFVNIQGSMVVTTKCYPEELGVIILYSVYICKFLAMWVNYGTYWLTTEVFYSKRFKQSILVCKKIKKICVDDAENNKRIADMDNAKCKKALLNLRRKFHFYKLLRRGNMHLNESRKVISSILK